MDESNLVTGSKSFLREARSSSEEHVKLESLILAQNERWRDSECRVVRVALLLRGGSGVRTRWLVTEIPVVIVATMATHYPSAMFGGVQS